MLIYSRCPQILTRFGGRNAAHPPDRKNPEKNHGASEYEPIPSISATFGRGYGAGSPLHFVHLALHLSSKFPHALRHDEAGGICHRQSLKLGPTPHLQVPFFAHPIFSDV